MDRLSIKNCPICNIPPMEWITPNGVWHIQCKNTRRQWHKTVQITDISDKPKAIRKWNEYVNSVNVEPKNVVNVPLKENAPVWEQYENTFYFRCSNCGYVLAPKLPICPNCKEQMNLGEENE